MDLRFFDISQQRPVQREIAPSRSASRDEAYIFALHRPFFLLYIDAKNVYEREGKKNETRKVWFPSWVHPHFQQDGADPDSRTLQEIPGGAAFVLITYSSCLCWTSDHGNGIFRRTCKSEKRGAVV